MNRTQWYPLLEARYPDLKSFTNIEHTLRITYEHLNSHENIVISVSGGSDSDCVVHLICNYFPEYLYKCRFVFIHTGLEWRATINHLKYLESKYNIKVETIRGLSVVLSVKRYGVPVISKYHSQIINGYTRDAPSAIQRINNSRTVARGYTFSLKQKQLAQAIKDRQIKVSDKCCKYSKKQPFDRYVKQISCDLSITGERKMEGGIRAISYTSCFVCAKSKGYDKYMPLYWWDDKTKEDFKKAEGIRYSDCYEVYGMLRTGCCGCPCNSRVNHDLNIMRTYEPSLFKACMNVFGQSYKIMDEFKIRKQPILEGLE